MASIKDPRRRGADCPNAPTAAAIRTSESLETKDETQVETLQKPLTPKAVDFSLLQARYG